MPVYQIKRFTRIETLRSIRPKSLLALLRPHRKFFAEQNLTLPPAKEAAKLDLSKLAQLLATPELHPPRVLADALYYINEMATRAGMDALLAELKDEQIGIGMFDVEPADVVVRVWLKDPELVERKRAAIIASRPRRFEYFQSYEDPPPPLPAVTPALLAPLEAHLDAVFGAKGRGRGVQVRTYTRGSDDSLFMIRHGEPRRREGALAARFGQGGGASAAWCPC